MARSGCGLAKRLLLSLAALLGMAIGAFFLSNFASKDRLVAMIMISLAVTLPAAVCICSSHQEYLLRARFVGHDAVPPGPQRAASIPAFDLEQRRKGFEASHPVSPFHASDSKADLCCICLEAKHEGQPCWVLSCRHSFHVDCIVNWLLWRHDTDHFLCPLCRQESFLHRA
mmetsp:Transcript_108262/g.311919  ORF Transcript_108262/g.311919 Transcript_108262/m.311919 type:complete len:171 (-) Transcript_108262:208-720(-)